MTNVVSADGTQVAVTTTGHGPGVVLIHGGGVTSSDYRRLAAGLAEHCTVHSYDRRGYDRRAIPGQGLWLAAQLADLQAIIDSTGATRLLGHSAGAFVALQAALRLPVERVAVYDPPLAVDGLLPTAWVDGFGAAVEAGDPVTALLVMARSMNESTLPAWLERPLTKLLLRSPIGTRMAALLPAILVDIRAIMAAAGPASDYAGIEAEVLLACGAKGPSYYPRICDHLAAAMPHGESVRLPKASHNAANLARASFVAPFAAFLGATS